MAELVKVFIETHEGAQHVFPDMPRDMLNNLVKLGGWTEGGKVMLVNVSGSVLIMEARIVKSLRVDDEHIWPRKESV